MYNVMFICVIGPLSYVLCMDILFFFSGLGVDIFFICDMARYKYDREIIQMQRFKMMKYEIL